MRRQSAWNVIRQQKDDEEEPNTYLTCIGVPFVAAILFLLITFVWGLVITTKIVMAFDPSTDITAVCVNNGEIIYNYTNVEIFVAKVFIITSIVINSCALINNFISR
tara:strand:+ start:281 stop:601 length:321 start_codon:yes stop_codon:yes gene_type:complete